MPLYEYVCKKCGEVLEVLQFNEEEKPNYCKKCNSQDCLEKLISVTSDPQFKGSGFYKTDYKNKSEKK